MSNEPHEIWIVNQNTAEHIKGGVDQQWSPDRHRDTRERCYTVLKGDSTPCSCGEVIWRRGIRFNKVTS
jgi:hypothetical protein